MNAYLAAARQGINSFWSYLASLILILFGMVFGGLISAIPLLLAERASPTLSLVSFMLSFLPALIAIGIAVRFIHRRPIATLWNATGRLRWERILRGAGLWFLLAALASGLEAALFPGRYTFSFRPEWWIYVLAALLTVPLQTTTEEVFFRGYLLQGLGQIVRQPIVLSLLNGLLFTLLHLANPEATVNLWLAVLYWWILGSFLAWITLKDEGLEWALGIHAANNLFSFALVGYPGYEEYTISLFTVSELDMAYSLASMVLAILVVWVVSRQQKVRQDRSGT